MLCVLEYMSFAVTVSYRWEVNGEGIAWFEYGPNILPDHHEHEAKPQDSLLSTSRNESNSILRLVLVPALRSAMYHPLLLLYPRRGC